MNGPLRKAVVLAAGKGQRLSPYTDQLPKPMISLAGHPLLAYLLRHLQMAGIEQVLLVIGYLGDKIQAHFGAGEEFDLALSYRHQDIQRGNGAATLLARDFVGDEHFILAWGDILCARTDVQKLIGAFPLVDPPDGLLLLEWVDDPHQGAAVYLDADGRISRIIEKPAPGTSTTPWNQAGLAAYSPRLFAHLETLTPSSRGELELTGAVQSLVSTGHLVQGLPLEAPRLHITNPEDIEPAAATLRSDPRYGL
ncbi:MAG: NTP transferase domain-containing protein [Candidatus Latescibacteria bacterium]|nr:NTP transferase domain-containing protein [Candidatus Latescibacterota bacterium]